jgi:hypothetical protein
LQAIVELLKQPGYGVVTDVMALLHHRCKGGVMLYTAGLLTF